MKKPKWVTYLENKWQVNTWRVMVILIVFACTGFTVMFLKKPILNLLVEEEQRTWIFTVLYYLFILPIYNVILLIYGFLFGQFNFFWEFEKRMFNRIVGKKKGDQADSR